MAEINRLEAQLATLRLRQIEHNTPLFIEEVLNLLDGVGEGFVGASFWAPKRYYSKIQGVKNIRFEWNRIVIKMLDRRGYDLPPTINIRGEKYTLYFVESKNFTEEVLD
jgi:hypothetical protein